MHMNKLNYVKIYITVVYFTRFDQSNLFILYLLSNKVYILLVNSMHKTTPVFKLKK